MSKIHLIPAKTKKTQNFELYISQNLNLAKPHNFSNPKQKQQNLAIFSATKHRESYLISKRIKLRERPKLWATIKEPLEWKLKTETTVHGHCIFYHSAFVYVYIYENIYWENRYVFVCINYKISQTRSRSGLNQALVFLVPTFNFESEKLGFKGFFFFQGFLLGL